MDEIVERLKPVTNQLDARESNERLAAVMAQNPKPRRARRGRMLLAAGGAAVLCVGATIAINSAINSAEDGRNRAGGERSRAVGEGECQPRLRIDGVVYLSVGYLEDAGANTTQVGRGELAACDDEGASPQGPYFPATPETVPVFSFVGQPARDVVGIDFPSGYEIYVAESLPASERQEILKAITSAN